jgi:hypothetical protein
MGPKAFRPNPDKMLTAKKAQTFKSSVRKRVNPDKIVIFRSQTIKFRRKASGEIIRGPYDPATGVRHS